MPEQQATGGDSLHFDLYTGENLNIRLRFIPESRGVGRRRIWMITGMLGMS